MKLDKEIIDFIENVLKNAQSVGIDEVIIEEGLVRAIDEGRTVVLYQNKNVPDLPFDSIGFNRISVFLSRCAIVKSMDNFTFNVIVDDEDGYVGCSKLKGTNTVVDYRGKNPAKIQAPRQVNDTLIYNIQLNAEAVDLMQKGQSAMGGEIITISGDENVSFEISDINGDAFKHSFATEFELLDEDASETFTHKYPIKVILALFKQNSEGTFKIGEKGILNIVVNDLDFYVLPQV